MNTCTAAGEKNVHCLVSFNLLKASRKKILTFHDPFQMAELEILHFVEYNIYLSGWDNKLVRHSLQCVSPLCKSKRSFLAVKIEPFRE